MEPNDEKEKSLFKGSVHDETAQYISDGLSINDLMCFERGRIYAYSNTAHSSAQSAKLRGVHVFPSYLSAIFLEQYNTNRYDFQFFCIYHKDRTHSNVTLNFFENQKITDNHCYQLFRKFQS